MERINKHNFEAYFLDYHEGRLSSEEEKLVMAFIQDNPECFDAFEDYDSVTLTPPNVHYPDKSELFRTEVSLPDPDEWEYLCIAYMEGDLSGEEKSDFEHQVADPEKKRILDVFMATKSVPDESIQFENKAFLKKKAVLIPRWIYGAVSAAAILILGWIIISPFSDTPDKSLMAEENTREVIFINKIEHPSLHERLASSDNGNTRNLIRSAIFNIAEEDPGMEDIGSLREYTLMASLNSQKPVSVNSGYNALPNSADVFAYRAIPGIEDEEYQTLLAFSGDFIRKQLLNQDPDLVEKTKFSFWELADAGLEKVSKTFGANADIEREYNEAGELMAVSFESPLVGFNTPIRRRSPQID